jgi:hypothetical protein
MAARIKRVCGDESAEVEISDGVHECLAHCFPCEAVVGDVVTEPLGVFDCDEPVRCSDDEVGFTKLQSSYFAYRVVGRVVDVSNAVVAVGEILLYASRLPADIQTGDTVGFDCVRLDFF